MCAFVMVAEDDTKQAELVRRYLRREDHSVLVVSDGRAAVDQVRSRRPDLLILDVMMPQMDGLDVIRTLRRDYDIPVLMVTARSTAEDKLVGFDLGADDYLTKPFSYVVLAARLRALLRRGASPRPAVLRAGDLSLDPASRAVRRGQVGVELTAREFSLLEYLMRHSGSVVSKSELLAHVWDDPDEIADLNVVEVYVGYLRRKIDAPFGRKSVQTVRGAGYLLAGDGG